MTLAVAHSTDYERIADLPRRVVSRELAEEWATALTPHYARSADARLRAWQAAALVEARECRGAFLALPVGIGKTLVSWLLPTALEARRTLLLVPASLREKTAADFTAFATTGVNADGHRVGRWVSPSQIMIESRELLQTIQGSRLLEEYAPDLVVIDEADALSNPGAAAPKRVDRFARAHDCAIVTMSGTPGRKSITNYAHQLWWTLGDAAPVPLDPGERERWALALDDYDGPRIAPGILGATVDEARAWYAARLRETPGVLIVDEDSCDAPITFRFVIAREDPAADEHFRRYLEEGANPGGIPVSDGLEGALLEGQVGCGLYSYWDPPPPEPWREARRVFARFVRGVIDATARSHAPLDTEAQVVRRFRDRPEVARWLALKGTFNDKAHRRVAWFSRSGIDSCLAWLGASGEPGIVWTGSVEFGRALARDARLEYYGRKGQSAGGVGLHAAPRDRSLVASWEANKRGFNLQAWRRALLVIPPRSARDLEQTAGRLHRAGQDEHVEIDVLVTSGGIADRFERTLREAAFARQTLTLTQKILRADIVRTAPRITARNEFRWARKEGWT